MIRSEPWRPWRSLREKGFDSGSAVPTSWRVGTPCPRPPTGLAAGSAARKDQFMKLAPSGPFTNGAGRNSRFTRRRGGTEGGRKWGSQEEPGPDAGSAARKDRFMKLTPSLTPSDTFTFHSLSAGICFKIALASAASAEFIIRRMAVIIFKWGLIPPQSSFDTNAGMPLATRLVFATSALISSG